MFENLHFKEFAVVLKSVVNESPSVQGSIYSLTRRNVTCLPSTLPNNLIKICFLYNLVSPHTHKSAVASK